MGLKLFHARCTGHVDDEKLDMFWNGSEIIGADDDVANIGEVTKLLDLAKSWRCILEMTDENSRISYGIWQDRNV